MVGKRKSAGTGDDRLQGQFAQLFVCFPEQVGKGFLNVCKMALVIGKEKLVLFVEDRNFNSGGTDVDSESIFLSVMNQTPFIIRNNLNTLYDKNKEIQLEKGRCLTKKYKVLVKMEKPGGKKAEKRKFRHCQKRVLPVY